MFCKDVKLQSAEYCMLTKGTEVIIQVQSNWRMQHHSEHNVQGDKEKAALRQEVFLLVGPSSGFAGLLVNLFYQTVNFLPVTCS